MSGSYGVNVAGFDRYKEWIERGWDASRTSVRSSGPCTRSSRDNIAMLRGVSGLDDVSFHMSGTEAVMAAVRLARFNTGREADRLLFRRLPRLVGRGRSRARQRAPARRLSDAQGPRSGSLEYPAARAREIAAVLVNPVQSFHPELAAAQ